MTKFSQQYHCGSKNYQSRMLLLFKSLFSNKELYKEKQKVVTKVCRFLLKCNMFNLQTCI